MAEGDRREVLLIGETDRGIYLRRVADASPLAFGVVPGVAAEEATREAAAIWGLPDFVFRSRLVRQGPGVRERGDGIVAVTDLGAVVQVKARTVHSGNRDRERAWLNKKIKEATGQAHGTIRRISGEAITLTNERGREIAFDGMSQRWVAVVVLDHPGLSGFTPEAKAVVLLRRDWEFLFEQLKSTDAVIRYLHRVADEDPVELGTEVVRYYQLAEADAGAAPNDLDQRYLLETGRRESFPLLPREPAGTDDLAKHLVLRQVMEDMAISPLGEAMTTKDVLDVLAAIDTLPVGSRTELGGLLLEQLAEVAEAPPGAMKWRIRTVLNPTGPILLFVPGSGHDEYVQTALGGLVSLRLTQIVEQLPEMADRMVVGVLLTPRHDGLRPWDTTIAATRGDQNLEARLRAQLEEFFGVPGRTQNPG